VGERGWGFDRESEDALRAHVLAAPAAVPAFELAGWWRRVWAYVIDVVILFVALVVLVAIGSAVSEGLAIALVIVWVVAIFLGYWTYFEGGESGQTLGKRALGIRVRSDTGGRAGYGRAFGRNLIARLIGLIPFVGIVDVLWPLWDGRKQCLHDKAASTIVVRA
jgi:uncharacterized RDD family membrane protein YckC